jgi:hypothetical protein
MKIKDCPANGQGTCLNEALIEDLIDALRVTQDTARMTVMAADVRFTLSPIRAVENFNRYCPEIYRILEEIENDTDN